MQTRMIPTSKGYKPPITPAVRLQIARELTRAGQAVMAMQQVYPAQRPPVNPKRKPYRRTGTYGRSQRVTLAPSGDAVDVVLYASYRGKPYSSFVGGFETTGPEDERQTADMRGRGWASIERSADKVMPVLEKRIAEILSAP